MIFWVLTFAGGVAGVSLLTITTVVGVGSEMQAAAAAVACAMGLLPYLLARSYAEVRAAFGSKAAIGIVGAIVAVAAYATVQSILSASTSAAAFAR